MGGALVAQVLLVRGALAREVGAGLAPALHLPGAPAADGDAGQQGGGQAGEVATSEPGDSGG